MWWWWWWWGGECIDFNDKILKRIEIDDVVGGVVVVVVVVGRTN